MYDRTQLVTAAERKGDTRRGKVSAAAVGRRLGVPPNTAWRLLNGQGEPKASLVALVERHYGIKARHLNVPKVSA